MCTPLLQSTARAFLEFWETQDNTNTTAQANLLPAFDSAARNTTPDPYMAAPATPAFEFDEEAEPDATVENKEVQVFEEMAVARMLTGAAAAAPVSSADMYRLTVGSIDFEEEFPQLFAKKKNRCSTAHAFVTFVKANDDMMFPSTAADCPTGRLLRSKMSALASQLKQEYNPPLLAITLTMIEALSQSRHGDELHVLFQKCIGLDSDESILKFEADCAAGIVDIDGMRYDQPVGLPGFARFTTGANKIVWWTRFATAAINKICFENIRQIEEAFARSLNRWKAFKISSVLDARTANVDEQKLFVEVKTAAAACGETCPSEMQRVSEHLLANLFGAAKKNMIRLIAKGKMAKASVTRSFFFKVLEEFVAREDHAVAMCQPASTPAAANADTALKCCDCSASFVFTGVARAEFAAKKPNPWADPKRCKNCSAAQREKLKGPGLTMTAMPVIEARKNTSAAQDNAIVQGEQTIVCRSCDTPFTLGAGQVEWYSKQTDKDGTPWTLPKSCEKCRAPRERHCMMICDSYCDDPWVVDSELDTDSDAERDGILYEE
jgi:hypothetical protein